MTEFNSPEIDYAAISPLIALATGICVVLLVGLLRVSRTVVGGLALATVAAAAGLSIWQFGAGSSDLVAGALRLDQLGLAAGLIALFAAACAIVLALREPAATDAGLGAFAALLLGAVLGMFILAQAQNLIAFFVGLELLSIPLYVLCGSAVRKAGSLEAGLKYLIVGSVGSATLLYGFALIYGGSGSTDYTAIATGISEGDLARDTLILLGTAMATAGLAFKLSLAPFHQWTPDVYQGAPTPVTAFMAVATKAAAFVALARLFEVALAPVAPDWDAALAALAVTSIIVGNVGAIGQNSLKRLLGYSSIAQAGYMLAGIVVFSERGLEALVFYLAAYTLMNLAVFSAIVVRERETDRGDDISAFNGIGTSRPWLAWPVTIGMIGLAGLPGSAGFIGKIYLIEATVQGDYAWLGVAIVIGTMVSLAYYLRVLAAVWIGVEGSGDAPGSGLAGDPDSESAGEQAGTADGRILLAGVGVLCAAATVFFGVIPSPLVDFAQNAAQSLGLPG